MLNFLFNKAKCTHNKVSLLNHEAYCPDCGQEVKIFWRILRCKECSSKRKSYVIRNSFIPVYFLTRMISGTDIALLADNLAPEERFCKKCGSLEYYVEVKENIEFFDYEYAVMLKEEVKVDSKIKKTLQIWIEEENNREIFSKPKLLQAF